MKPASFHLSVRWVGVMLALALAGSATGSDAPFVERLTTLQGELALSPTNTALLFKLGDLCHDEGARDNPQAVKLAEKYFDQLLALEPKHAIGLALLGSTFTMKARDAFWPHVRLRLVKEGNRKMDAAVQLAPDDARVRFVRAINNFHMPKFLGREELVRTDFAWLWAQVKENSTGFSDQFRQEVALHQGLVLQKHEQCDQAVAVWQSGLAIDPDSEFGKKIREQLDAASGK